MGGLPRRQTVVNEIRAEQTSFVVDAGDLTWKSSSVPDARLAQQRLKADLQFDVYAAGGVDAMVPGDADLALGVEWLAAAAEKYKLPYVAANLRCENWSVEPGRIVERDGIRVAFIGVIGPNNSGKCGASSTVPAVSSAIRSLGEADIHVLLSHQPTEEDQAIVRSVPEIDIVVNGHGRSPFHRPVHLDPDAIQLASGTRGKKIGVAEVVLRSGATGFEIDGIQEDLAARMDELSERVVRAKERVDSARNERALVRAQQRLSRLETEQGEVAEKLASSTQSDDRVRNRVANRLVELSDDVDDDPVVREKVDLAKTKLESAAAMIPPKSPASSPRPFVGDKPCLACHKEQHAQWKSTAHAYAWSTLVREKRSQDLDCWSCHVTGAHHPEGPKSPSEVGVLRNVGCESCHGPGQKHVTVPLKSNILLRPTISSCQNCHDGIKDEGRFEPEAYMSKVTH